MQKNESNNKFSSTVTGAFLTVTFIIIISRALGFFREILFANYFGTSNSFDIYLVGAVIPVTINTVIQYLAQNFFIPQYNYLKSIGENPDERFFKSAFIVFQIVGIVGAIILYFLSNSIISYYLQASDNDSFLHALNIFKIFLITIPLNCGISILIANNQSKYDYTYPAVSRLFLNLLIIPILVLFQDKFGIYTIPLGFVVSILLQYLFLILKSQTKINFSIFGNYYNLKYLKLFGLSIVSILLIETIGQVYMITDRLFYSKVDIGGISALNYGMNIYLLPVSIFTIGFATVLFPKFSEDYRSNSLGNLNRKFTESIKAILILFVPLSFLFYFQGDVIIKLIYERGNFSPSDTTMTFNVLKWYSISLFFYAAYAIMNKLLYSVDLVNSLLLITISGIIIKIVLNVLLVENYKQSGLALSTSFSFVFFFVSSLFLIHRRLGMDENNKLLKDVLFFFINGFISIGVVKILFQYVNSSAEFYNWLKVIIFSFIYFCNIGLLKHDSLHLITKVFNNTMTGFKYKNW